MFGIIGQVHRQTDKRFIEVIQKVGCLFLCIHYLSGKKKTPEELNEAWKECEDKGYIVDDYIASHEGVCAVLGLKARYTGEHVDAKEKIPFDVYAVGCYVRPGFTHFVVLSHHKHVIFDPTPNSKTVQLGHLKSMRFYKREMI